MAKRDGSYRELRRPTGLHGGEWRLNKGEPMEIEKAARKVFKSLQSDFSGTKGIRVRIHDSNGRFIGAEDIPKGASMDRIAAVLARRAGSDVAVFSADQCGRGWDDDDWDLESYG